MEITASTSKIPPSARPSLRSLFAFLSLALVLGLASSSVALDLYEWRGSGLAQPLILGVREGETPQAAAERYLKHLGNDPEIASVIETSKKMPLLKLEGFAKLTDGNIDSRVLMITNSPDDFTPRRLDGFYKSFRKSGVEPYLLPFAADLGLNARETLEFQQKLALRFYGIMALGGQDISPELFGRENTASVETNMRRDRFEESLLRMKINLVRAENGKSSRRHRLVGVCRGSQFIAEIMGYERGQDIPTDPKIPKGLVMHRQSEIRDGAVPSHLIRALPTSSNVLHGIVSGMTGSDVFLGHTQHHQHIRFKPGGELELAAIAPDGVTEALESKDGRILLFQFHPELMAEYGVDLFRMLGEKIVSRISETVTPYHKRSCRAVFAQK